MNYIFDILDIFIMGYILDDKLVSIPKKTFIIITDVILKESIFEIYIINTDMRYKNIYTTSDLNLPYRLDMSYIQVDIDDDGYLKVYNHSWDDYEFEISICIR